MTRVALALLLFAATTALADDDDEEGGRRGASFGLTPWVAMGPSWVTSGQDKTPDTVRHGTTVEFTGQALVVLPGDAFGIGVAAGYFGTGGRLGESDDRVNFTAFQVLGLFMIGLFERLSIHLKGGYLAGSMNDTEVPAGAVRFGGGLTVVFLRFAAGDFAASLDVTHTRVMSVDGAAPPVAFGATSGQLGFSFAFDPDGFG